MRYLPTTSDCELDIHVTITDVAPTVTVVCMHIIPPPAVMVELVRNENANVPPESGFGYRPLVGITITGKPAAGVPSGNRTTPESTPVEPGGGEMTPGIGIAVAGTNRGKSILSMVADDVIEMTRA